MDMEALPYLALLIGVLFLIGLAVTVLSTYAGLRVIDRRMRTCPNCGRAGGGQPLSDEEVAQTVEGELAGESDPLYDLDSGGHSSGATYKCDNCGHVWTSEITRRLPEEAER